MLISKHFDPVLGIDIHILVIPPAGPVPIPHPHISLVFDVIDYVPILGATVKVGGIPRSTAGSAGRPIPHIPMGGPFSKPPMNEDEILMGSTTVLADGGPLSFTALPTLSCHDIGAIAPPRKKKPKKSFGMVLPTSVVLSIPLGRPVMVGGPPTIDMMGLLMTGGFAALGAAFKKLRKVQKKSKRNKKLSDAIHDRAKKAMDKLGVPPNVRNKVHKGICTVTGHPVDVATGKMFTDHIDFSLPGPLPLVWERTWYSTSVYDGPLGHGWHHSYDVKLCEMNNAVAVRMADGRGISFPALDINETSFNRQERMTLFRDEEGYALDTSDRKRYRFTPFNGDKENQLLTSLSQTTSGAAIRFFYNEKAQLHQIIDSGNRPIHITYTDEGRIHQIYLPEPESNVTRDHTKPTFFCAVEHHYRHGMLVKVDDALQQPLQYHYDNKLLIKETFRSGLSFYFEYDGRDHNARCLRTWGDEGIYYRDIRYDTENNITWVKNSLGHVTTYYHNGVLPHRVVDPLGHASFTEYNEYSDVICETNALGYKTRFEFDEFGNKTKITSPDGTSIQFIFDEQQNLVEFINQLDSCWRYEYDYLNRVVAEIDPSNHATRYEYKEFLISAVTEITGNKIYFQYDQNYNLRFIGDGYTQHVTLEHNALGSLLSSKESNGRSQSMHYDVLNRVIKLKDTDGNICSFEYDGNDNVVRVKDENKDISFTYTGMRLASRTQSGTTVKFEYNMEEQLTAILNEHNHIYQFEYNACGEMISESGFDGGVRHFIRDAIGRAVRIIRPEQRHSLYSYDKKNRITKIVHSDGTYGTYEYRQDGELIKASNNSITLKLERDYLGRITKEYQGDFWVTSNYDSLGHRINLQSSLGLDQKITRNKRGDALHISTGSAQYEVDFKRDNQGLEIERSLPGGIKSRWNRDKLGRPLEHNIYQGTESRNVRTYVWGATSRLLKLIDGLNRETVIQHDSFGNLLSARYTDNSFDLRAPDAVGNLFQTYAKNDREYGPAGQLLAAHSNKGTTRYSYDSEGNLISKLEPGGKLWMYEWNGNAMLSKVIRPDKKIVTFEYDPFGRRISKTFENKITRWVWDGNNPLHEWIEQRADNSTVNQISKQQIIAETIKAELNPYLLQSLESQAPPTFTEGTLNQPITWLFEPDSTAPMAKLIGDEKYSIIVDHLGTPSIILDESGRQVWSAEISIWGNLLQLRGDANFCPFRFPGQYEDSETGLYYNRFRYFDPTAHQYISQDPIRLAGGMALYGYVKDPLVQTDPLGLSATGGGTLDQAIYLRGATQAEYRRMIDANIPFNQMGPALAGVMDTVTGEIFFDINHNEIPNVLAPEIRRGIEDMPDDILTGYIKTKGAGTHAEVYALNRAMLARPGSTRSEFIIEVINAGGGSRTRGRRIPQCPHCAHINTGASFRLEPRRR